MTKNNQFKKLGNTLLNKGKWFLVRAFKIKPQIVTGTYVRNLMLDIGISRDKIWFADQLYFVVSLNIIKDILKYDLVDEMKYEAEVHDCDDFAEVINARFRCIYRINTMGVARRIEAVDKDTREHLFWHRANIFLAVDNNRIKVFYLEPQTDHIVEMKTKEVIIGSREYKIDTVDF